MIINKIKLKNFRSYEDEVEFDFTPNSKKNIVLIGGENGAGKSTLFEAIKLCMFGPIVYGYQGFNSNYINKIKSNITYNAFKADSIDVFISLSITIPEGIYENSYVLIRSWTFENKKLVEHFEVFKNSNKLDCKALDMFENYLKSLIPPNLFDFFFFDGEELSNFFTGKNASLHLKEAILKLCNYDTLDVLKKQLLYYRKNTSKNSEEINKLELEYTAALNQAETLKFNLQNAEIEMRKLQEKYESLLIEKNLLDENFRKSGGLLESEKALLKSKENSLENERTEINLFIKDFCNETLPFLMLTKQLVEIKNQILAEESLNTFNNMKNKLTNNVLRDSLFEARIIPDTSLDLSLLPNLILSKVFDLETLNDINEIHQISNDDKNSVTSLVDKIVNNKEVLSLSILNSYDRINAINDTLKDIRQKIESSVHEDILTEYINSNLRVNEMLAQVNSQIDFVNNKVFQLKELLIPCESKVKKCKNNYLEAIQFSSSLEFSNKIIDTIDELLKDLTQDKIKEIEFNFIYIFKKLIRKESYIDDFEITENFETTLYVNKEYGSIDILNLINNLGLDEIEKRYGSKFIEGLLRVYNINNKKYLVNHINNSFKLESYILKTKVNINGFSKGEKQIFILCLIWSLIKTSGVEIPFIIDTPYARIDEAHRNTLTNDYFPNIGNQVIILSTNKEMDENLYKTIKPHISNEYLLQYQNHERKTNVINGYFFEV